MKWWYYISFLTIAVAIWKWRRIRDEVNMAVHSGIEHSPPEQLASERGVDTDVYSLGRAMQSEDSHHDARIGIGWAIKNHARNLHITITNLVTRNKNPSHYDHDGFYGRVVPGQYCATTLSPDDDTLVDADGVMSESIPDPTGGATLWDGPAGQDAAHARDPIQHPNNWATQKALRESEGYTLVELPGITSTVFWRR